MSQIKIYGLRTTLAPLRARLSDVIHECVMEALSFPRDKRAHRFILLDKEDFYYPEGRTDAYIIIEITMITGRSKEAKKKLVRLLFDRISEKAGIGQNDIEICIYECPAENWGFRGFHGDEVQLNYKINV